MIKKNFILILLPAFIFSYFILEGITIPFVGPNAFNFSAYSLMAHNYNQFGFLSTKFASITSVSKSLPQNPEYFFHHPPLLSVLISFVLQIFGDGVWQGRIVVIACSFGTLAMAYFIGEMMGGKKYGTISFIGMSVIPASSLFGKLIGQEALVLFFIMLTVFFSLKYLQSGRQRYLILGLCSTVFGVLSDWPMVLFCFPMVLLFVKQKRMKIGLLFPMISVFTAGGLLLWIGWVRSGFGDLEHGALERSVVGLSAIHFWPALWIGALLLRLFIYFNPLFCILAAFSLITIYKKFKRKALAQQDIVILIFGIFGIIYCAFYAEATFSHPYLVYYLLPFIVFSSAMAVEKFRTKYRNIFFSVGIILSILYLFVITIMKDEQANSNLWRYQLASTAREYLQPYETIVYNKFYVIDQDTWKYPLLINPVLQDKNDSPEFLKKYNHYVYSCLGTCAPYRSWVHRLRQRYQYIVIRNPEGEAYVFFLQEKQNGISNPENLRMIILPDISSKPSIILSMYRTVRNILNVPQI